MFFFFVVATDEQQREDFGERVPGVSVCGPHIPLFCRQAASFTQS